MLARARGQGLDGKDLTRIGRRAGVPVWAALGSFFEEYLATLEFEGSLDYAELILRAAVLANDPRAGRQLRESFRLVVVDEYQDTDPAQVALLKGLAGGGAQVVAVGDPDQAIYGFRGADVRGILRFPDVFAVRPASPRGLRCCARPGGSRGPSPRRPPVCWARYRWRRCPPRSSDSTGRPRRRTGSPRCEVRTFPTLPPRPPDSQRPCCERTPGMRIAPRAGVLASRMAVLVRNPAVHGPVVARALRAAGIPVWLPPDETPLADEPAVGVLLAVLGLALDPSSVPEATGRTLLAGPLGRADAVSIRALARAVLKERRGALWPARPPRGGGAPSAASPPTRC